MYISPHCRQAPVPPNFIKIGIQGQLIDIITYVKLLVDRFSGYGVLTPPKLPFPIDLLRRPYNSVRTASQHCEHNCPQHDSIPGPRALQSGMLPIDHCDLRPIYHHPTSRSQSSRLHCSIDLHCHTALDKITHRTISLYPC